MVSAAAYGYSRNTTPLLGAMGKDVVAYYDAITMSNTTHKSVPLLLTPVGSEDDFDGIYYKKGIVTAFKEAGYSTVFLSCQRRNHSIIDFLGCEADEVKNLKDNLSMMAQLPDDALVGELKKALKKHKGEKLFVLLHCYGSHFNYFDRYKRADAFYTPDQIPSASNKYRVNMVNAYDNSIRLTDMLLAGVINALKETHTSAAMCYVSDHGEDIFDDSRQRFLHSSPIPTYYQLRVPFLLWASPEFKTAYPDKWQTIVANQKRPIATNRVTFHTMLDLGGVCTSAFKADAAVSNKAFTQKPRLYVNDHNEYRPLDDCGFFFFSSSSVSMRRFSRAQPRRESANEMRSRQAADRVIALAVKEKSLDKLLTELKHAPETPRRKLFYCRALAAAGRQDDVLRYLHDPADEQMRKNACAPGSVFSCVRKMRSS